MANKAIKKTSTTIGVSHYTYFELISDTSAGLEYGDGYTLPGTVNITPTDSGGSNLFDADNGAYEVDTYIESPGHDIELADIPPEADAAWRGLETDEAGGVKITGNAVAPYFAVAWRTLKADGSHRYFRTQKGKYNFASNVGGKTKPSSGAPEHQTGNVSFAAVHTDYDDSLYYYIDDKDFTDEGKKEIAKKWFEDATYYPAASLKKTE